MFIIMSMEIYYPRSVVFFIAEDTPAGVLKT